MDKKVAQTAQKNHLKKDLLEVKGDRIEQRGSSKRDLEARQRDRGAGKLRMVC